MRRLGSVQRKMTCVFVTEVTEEPSRKRDGQQFQVAATETVHPIALEANVGCALATEKLDGTCCYVTEYKGRPYLWARLDRKPNKQAEKRFRKYQQSHRTFKGFKWNVEEDFKAVPETWIPAHGVRHHGGLPVPDEHGHIPGWVPVESDSRQYCWHAAVVDYEAGAALLLRPGAGDPDVLEIASVPLEELLEQTLELIGTNINGNPYGLGSRKRPVHYLVSHGSLPIPDPPPVDFQQLRSWFQQRPAGGVEGIVWHCQDGTLVKVHRHHLGLPWPCGGTQLGGRAVLVQVDGVVEEYDSSRDLFTCFCRLNRRRFPRLQDVRLDPGDVRLDRGDVRLVRGDVRLDRGDVRLDRGDVRLDPGDVRLDPGDVRLDRGDVRLDRGDVPLDPGDVRLDRGDVHLDRGDVRLDRGDGTPPAGFHKRW
ncbi:RNA ligase 1 [Antennarius striatus]|uniref:RNA ligase 1 n=1 Tax=Antennarius striatus TaxID=241820 RepID=UPI0035B109FA